MAKFRFPLEKVLRHREIQEDLAKKDFQEAQAALNIELDRVQRLQDQKHTAFKIRHQREVQQGTSPESLTQVHEFLKGQDLRIERQMKKIQEAEKLVEEFREVLRLKAVDTKIIEGLKERKKEEFRIEQRKHEQKVLDDLTTTRYALRDKK